MDWDKVIVRLAELAGLGLLGALGGLANYVYLSLKQQKNFDWRLFVANLFLALFTGILIGQFIDESNSTRDGLIMASGFCAYPILNIVETWVIQYVKDKLAAKRGE